MTEWCSSTSKTMNVRARSSGTMRAGAVMAWSISSGFRSIRSIPRSPVKGYFRSFSERVVNDLLQCYLNVHPTGRGVFHHNEKHVLGAVDHDIDPGGAVPFDLAERARRRRHRIAGIGADAETIAKSKTVAWIIEIVARNARPRPDVIRRRGGERCGAEIGLPVQRPAVEQH